MRQPGIEPGSTAWKAAMLTTIPLTLTHPPVDYPPCIFMLPAFELWDLEQKFTAVTRIRTWVTAATTQGPNH